MTVTTDRTWDLPRTPWVMRMTWSELLFAHWAVDPRELAPLIPAGLSLDTRDGHAWIGVVPFLMSDVAPRCCPAVGKLSRFLELNVRTYVTLNGKPGVWFFSLDAENPIAVRIARATFSLPYMNADMAISGKLQQKIAYKSTRTHRGEPPATFQATYKATGSWQLAAPGSLEHWLTARYCLYSADKHGRLYRGEIDHPPWQLAPASCEFQHNTMCEPLGIELADQPHLVCAQSIKVRAWMAAKL